MKTSRIYQIWKSSLVIACLLICATAATLEGVRLAMVQYDTGLTNYNNVMTMQRDLFQLQDQLAASEAQLDFELIALYKAVGGGW